MPAANSYQPQANRTPRAPTWARPGVWSWAGAGLVLGLLAGALVFAPARWLAAGLQASGAPLQLHNAQGTLWNGSGQLMVGRSALPGRLEWTLRPQWQDAGPALSARWRANCCLSEAWTWRLQPEGQALRLHIDDLPAHTPLRISAALLGGLGAPWNTLQPQGQLALSTERLSLRASAQGLELRGAAQLDALALSTSLSTLQPVGSYRLRLQGSGSPPPSPNPLTLATLEGALQLQGQGALQGGRLVFHGEASAAGGMEEALSNLLNIIGQREGARSLIHLG